MAAAVDLRSYVTKVSGLIPGSIFLLTVVGKITIVIESEQTTHARRLQNVITFSIHRNKSSYLSFYS